jgi:outer membrane protein OmpA-like peptidoglycan-associated protein
MKNYQELLFGVILLLLGSSLHAQSNKDTLNVNGHADCETRLIIETRKTVGPTTSPKGHGDVLEFNQNDRENLHFMERENNTVWYEFTTKTKGKLTFELEPLDSLNDYDFVLYKYTDENFCADVQSKKILPIRTNFSRNKPEIFSKTGLKNTSEDALIPAGVNAAYSQFVSVNSKEKYVLLVNNVYDNGEGHLLHFDYGVSISFAGKVVNVEGEGNLESNITLTNTKTGAVVAETISDSITGAYKLVFDLPKTQLNDPLHLEVLKEGYFFYDTVVTAFKIATKMRDIELKTPIRKLKKGERFVVSNILFHGNSPKPMSASLLSMKALYKTMKRNKKLKISIEGHTNGCSHGEVFSQSLSEGRAATVHNFLIENGIDANRLSSIGYGCAKMLHSMTSPAAHLNRRVEIEIVDF